jgi:outer membrane cobalamin receptor
MRSLRLLVGAALLAACAHAGQQAARSEERPTRVLVTGSRLPQAVDPVTGRVLTSSHVSVYTPEDVGRTGVIDLGEALRRASPSQP